jgi:carbohydrate diacid regulator
MLNQQIANKILARVSTLINQELYITDKDGRILAGQNISATSSLNLDDPERVIAFKYSGQVTGFVVLTRPIINHNDVTPLIRSLAELILHQSIVVESIPRQDERLDKFIYDLLNSKSSDSLEIIQESRLFDISLTSPRVIIIIEIKDDYLTYIAQESKKDREIRLLRYKNSISRALNSFYTSSRDNIIAYLGDHTFCVLKDLVSSEEDERTHFDSFKKSLPAIYPILKSELKLPITIGVGNYHEGLSGIRQSYHEAISAIELGSQNWDDNKIYHIDDFGVVAPLLTGVDENNIYFSRELLERLGRNKEIIQTLESFFNNDMSLTKTSDELNIHRNTLVYRLDRINEVLDLDPRIFDDAVKIKLAILYKKFVGVKNEA